MPVEQTDKNKSDKNITQLLKYFIRVKRFKI
jgi:hypothetical protein